MHMKYILLLFFLLALTNSKLPKASFKSLLENFNSRDGEDEDPKDPCESGSDDKDKCVALPVSEKNAQCCYITSVNQEDETEKICELSPKPLKDISNIIKAKQFKPLLKEVMGFAKYNGGEISPDDFGFGMDLKVHCKDGDIELNIEDIKYTDDEIKILSSGEHCLNYTLSGFIDEDTKDLTCQNGKLLKSSKDAGIECGNLVVNIKGNSTEETFKSCMIFPFEMLSKMTMPPYLNEKINEIASFFALIGVDKITIELSDSKGHKVSYDSDTGKIISNNGSILTISKY